MKLVKEILYENRLDLMLNFTDDSTDPVKDMGIGVNTIIRKWLRELDIKDFKLTKRHSINVYNSVMISHKNINNFPEYIKFNHIMGGFHCDNNNLFSLKGSPYSVTGSFMVSHNNLYCLKNGPVIVKESYGASFNRLESLEGIAEVIGRSLYINNNKLKNLEYIPKIIRGDLNIRENPIETLEYFPEEVEGSLYYTLSDILTREAITKRCKVHGYLIVS